MKYCALEGSCYAGKTTTLERAKTHGISTLDQLRIPGGGLLHSPEDNLEAYLSKIDALMTAEMARTQLIERLSSRVSLLLVGRVPLSTVVYEHAAMHFGIGKQDDRLRSRDYAMKQLEVAVTSGRVILPNCMVVMDVANKEEFYRRVQERGSFNSPLSDYDASIYWADLTYKYATGVLGRESVARYSAHESDLPQQEAIEAATTGILGIIQELPTSKPSF